MDKIVKARMGAEDALALLRRNGAGKHADRRTRRNRTRDAQKRNAIRDAQ